MREEREIYRVIEKRETRNCGREGERARESESDHGRESDQNRDRNKMRERENDSLSFFFKLNFL